MKCSSKHALFKTFVIHLYNNKNTYIYCITIGVHISQNITLFVIFSLPVKVYNIILKSQINNKVDTWEIKTIIHYSLPIKKFVIVVKKTLVHLSRVWY